MASRIMNRRKPEVEGQLTESDGPALAGSSLCASCPFGIPNSLQRRSTEMQLEDCSRRTTRQ